MVNRNLWHTVYLLLTPWRNNSPSYFPLSQNHIPAHEFDARKILEKIGKYVLPSSVAFVYNHLKGAVVGGRFFG